MIDDRNQALAQQLAIEQVVSGFETAVRSGERPRLDDWIAKQPRLPADELFRQLLAIELFHDGWRDSDAARADLVVKHPGRESLVKLAIEDLADQNAGQDLHSGLSAIVETAAIADGKVDTGSIRLAPGQFDQPVGADCIGHYRLTGKLGHGGMGVVYRAVDLNLNREVALKVILRHDADSVRAIRRFHTEAQAQAKLRHPHIVPVLDFGYADASWYLAMPLLEGGRLDRPTVPLEFTINSVLERVVAVADGVDHAHQHGVIHRDLKPANILLDRDLRPFVSDFGLARLAGDSDLTGTEEVFGTPAYMSPEQCGGAKHVGPATDIYSLGVILYQFLAGKLPFKCDSTAEMARLIRDELPVSPREINPALPRDLDTIVMKCLAKRADERYATAAELAADIRRYLACEPILARPVSAPVRAWRWARRKPALAATIALSLVSALAAAIAAGLFWQNAGQQEQIANAAVVQKNQAVAAADRERALREAADAARTNAEDAARFAEANQLRATFLALETARQSGRLFGDNDTAGQLALVAEAWSIDCDWYRKQCLPDLRDGPAFCTSDWGLYDAAISPDGQRLAIVDRSGRVAVHDLATGKRLVLHHENESDPATGFVWPRPAGLAGRETGFRPVRQPEYFSSVAWNGSDRLVAASLSGELIEFGPEETARRVVWKHDHALLIARASATADDLLVSDDGGAVLLVSNNGTIKARRDLGESIEFLMRDESGVAAWVAVHDGGQLALLDEKLETMASVALAGRVHDVRVLNRGEQHELLVAVGNQPLLRLSVNRKTGQPTLEEVGKLDTPFGPGQSLIQVLFDPVRDQIAGLGNDGDVCVWRESSGDLIGAFHKLPTADIRLNATVQLTEPDQAEQRARGNLFPAEDGLITVDCMGTVRTFDLAGFGNETKWIEASHTFGPQPVLGADPVVPGRVWGLDRTGKLSLLALGENRLMASIPDAHAGGRAGLQVLANGDVITVGNDRFARVWRLVESSIEEVRRLESPSVLLSIAVHEARQLAAGVNADGKLMIWDFATGKELRAWTFSVDRENGEDGFRFLDGRDDGKGDLAVPQTPIETGRVAFSRNGNYLAAFGPWQSFDVLETATWTRVEVQQTHIASFGGIGLAFSPVHESRFLAGDSIGLIGNSVASAAVAADGHDRDKRLWRGHGSIELRDTQVTPDGKRLAGVDPHGTIRFFSPEHFVPLAQLETGVRDACSLAIGAGNSSLIVAGRNGRLVWFPVRADQHARDPDWQADGVVHLVAQPGERPNLRLGSIAGFSAARDSTGHLSEVFLAGSPSDIGPDNRLFRLEKRDGIWRLEQQRFEGDDHGPCLHAQLFSRPDGKLVGILRQGLRDLGDYEGRVLNIHERPDQTWPSEEVVARGNMGFNPFPLFDERGAIRSILHFNYQGGGLVRSDRPDVPGEWTNSVMDGCCGIRLRGVTAPDGSHHLLTCWSRGHDTGPPRRYLRMAADGTATFGDAPGSLPFLLADGNLVSWDAETGRVHLLDQETLDWQLLATTPLDLPAMATPMLDRAGQLWWVTCEGSHLSLVGLDVPAAIRSAAAGQPADSSVTGQSGNLQVTEPPDLWRFARIQLDRPLPQRIGTLPGLNADGRLEILLVRQGPDGMVAVVETTSRFPAPSPTAPSND